MSDTQWDFLTGDPDRDQRNVRILLDSVEELYGPRGLDELMRSAVEARSSGVSAPLKNNCRRLEVPLARACVILKKA